MISINKRNSTNTCEKKEVCGKPTLISRQINEWLNGKIRHAQDKFSKIPPNMFLSHVLAAQNTGIHVFSRLCLLDKTLLTHY